ncbi:MAG: UDP-N-acetylmuramoyl-tripeptide--D-alanyl-D-alanine ligase [Chitinophagales bacterium]
MPLTTKKLYTYFRKNNHVCTDSRKVQPNDLFFALKGPNFDGNVYADDALKRGATYAVIDNPEFQKSDRHLLVQDTLTALQDLATYHLKEVKPICIAITGSNGKTTTKELITSVLATTFNTQATIGNLNNHIGVPLTLLSLVDDTKMMIVEMGANHIDEINFLCSIALPNFGLITNIGKAHLEGFGSVNGIVKAKGELFDFLDASGGHSFLNMNDFRVAKIGYFIQNASTYGSGEWYKTDVRMEGAEPFLKVNWYPKVQTGKNKRAILDPIDIQTQLIGAYNLDNVTAAIAVGSYFNVSAENIKQAIEAYKPNNQRSQILEKNGNTIVLDAYNANPTSMEAALQNFAKMKGENKVVILGDMLEMGKESETEHLKLLKMLLEMKVSQVVLVGNELMKADKKRQFLHFQNTKDARNWFDEQHFQNALILLKGSRSIALEKIVE